MVQEASYGQWPLGVTFAKSWVISSQQLSPTPSVKSQTPPQPHPTPRKPAVLTFLLPPHAPRRLRKGSTEALCAFSCIRISKPWSQAFNIWTKHCEVNTRKKQLALSLMGCQGGCSGEVAQTRQAGLQLDTSDAGDGTAHLKSARRGTSAGRATIQVTSTTNLTAPGNTSVATWQQAFGVQAFSLTPDPRARKLLGKGDALATSTATVLLWREVVR